MFGSFGTRSRKLHQLINISFNLFWGKFYFLFRLIWPMFFYNPFRGSQNIGNMWDLFFRHIWILQFKIVFYQPSKFFRIPKGTNKNQGVQAPKHPTKLPRGADTEKRMRIVAGIAADAVTDRVEVANVDGVAAGRLHASPIPLIL